MIRANKDLFDRLWALGDDFSAMRNIIQNDMELSDDEIYYWLRRMDRLIVMAKELKEEVSEWVFNDSKN